MSSFITGYMWEEWQEYEARQLFLDGNLKLCIADFVGKTSLFSERYILDIQYLREVARLEKYTYYKFASRFNIDRDFMVTARSRKDLVETMLCKFYSARSLVVYGNHLIDSLDNYPSDEFKKIILMYNKLRMGWELLK